jgi:hypothetical protein
MLMSGAPPPIDAIFGNFGFTMHIVAANPHGDFRENGRRG